MPNWKFTQAGESLARRSQRPPTPQNNGALPTWTGPDNREMYDLPQDWNYRSSPTSPEGDPLPNGALGWRPNGQPYYGEGFTGLWNQIKSTWNQPDKEPLDFSSVRETTEVKPDILGSQYNMPTFDTISKFGDWLGSNLAQAPGGLKYAGRGLVGTLQAAIGAFDIASKYGERVLGTAEQTLEQLGDGSSIEEYRSPNFMRHLPPWLSWLEELNPGVLAYNTARAATAPKKTYGEVRDIISENWQASRMAYSIFHDEALKAEYLRRYNAGDYQFAETLAEELEIPSAEFGGRLVLDPTNLVGMFSKGASATRKLSSVADEMVNVSKGLDDAIDLARYADDAQGSESFIKLIASQIEESAKVANSLDDFSKERGLFSLTQSGKQFHVGRRTGELVNWVARYSDNPDDAIDVFHALAQVASGNESEVSAGISVLLNQPTPKPLFSRAGQELGIVMRRMLDDGAGNIDWSGYLKEFENATEAGSIDDLVAWMDKKNSAALEQMFPTIKQMVDAGQEVNPIQRAIAGVHAAAQEKIYQPINRFFAGIYMGLSPGYAFRNALTNNLHIVVDEGVEAFGKGTLFNPDRWLNVISDWGVTAPRGTKMGMALHASEIGETLSGVQEGRSLASILRGGGSDEKWFQAFSRVSEKFEQRAGMRVIGHAVDDAMRRMITPGKALPDIKPLIDAGFSNQATETLMSLVVGNKGNVDAAVKQFLRAAKTGNIDVYSTLQWLNPATTEALHNFEIYDDVADAVKTGETLDDQLSRIDELFEAVKSKASDVTSEHAGVNLDDPPDGAEFMMLEDQAVGWRYSTEPQKILTNNQLVANSNTMDAYQQAIINAQREIGRLRPDLIQDIEQLEKRFSDILQGSIRALAGKEDKQFTRKIWAYTEEIRNAEGGNWLEYWNKIGIPADPPPNLRKRDLLNALWDQYGNPERRAAWQGTRDIIAAKSEAFLNQLGALTEVDTSKYLEEARSVWEHARTLDDVVIAADNKMYRLSSMLRGALVQENEAKAVRILASRYGIGTITDAGKPYDSHILQTLNKYSELELDSLDNIKIEDAWRALENMRTEKGLGPVIEDLYLLLGQEKPAEAAQVVGEVTEEAIQAGRKFIGETIDTPVVPPYDGRTPSKARYLTEQLDGIAETLEKVKAGMRKNYGNVEPASLTGDMGARLDDWAKTAKERIQEARLIASQYANEARAFTLHDYPAKRNFDLLTSYVMPYNFWYSRTYAKWFTSRIWKNPGWIAAYAKYKDNMSKIHAGAPEWWKYNVNTNELLGLNSDNPLFFNLEATLNPLNGMLGIDFDDPYKRVDWWTSTMDYIGRFGPSIWTPLSIATAIALHKKGESGAVGTWEGRDVSAEDYNEAAGRWAGRLIPQSATFKALTSILNIRPGGVETDPSVLYFSGGTDPYERRRIGRALAAMVDDGTITEAQADDAARLQSGEVWDQARQNAAQWRNWGQVASFFMGVGFKARSQEDMQIDRFYQDYNMLWQQEPLMSPEDFRTAVSDLRNQYPFMDALLIAKKGGLARDRAFAYNVLSRIPPGQSSDIAEVVGVPPDLLGKFYDDKGHIEDWTETDRQRFLSGIIDISALLDLPDDATQSEWDDARNNYSKMLKEAESRFGDDIWERVDVYYQMTGESQQEREAARAFLESNPIIEQAMDWRTRYIIENPLLAAYYGGVDKVEGYYKGMMYDQIEAELGDVWDLWDQYYFLKDTDGNYRSFYKQNKNTFERYYEIRDTWSERIAQEMADFNKNLPESKPAWFRQDADLESIGAQQLYEQLTEQRSIYEGFTYDQWKYVLGSESTAAVLKSGDIPVGAEDYLEDIADDLGISLEEMIQLVGNAQ